MFRSSENRSKLCVPPFLRASTQLRGNLDEKPRASHWAPHVSNALCAPCICELHSDRDRGLKVQTESSDSQTSEGPHWAELGRKDNASNIDGYYRMARTYDAIQIIEQENQKSKGIVVGDRAEGSGVFGLRRCGRRCSDVGVVRAMYNGDRVIIDG